MASIPIRAAAQASHRSSPHLFRSPSRPPPRPSRPPLRPLPQDIVDSGYRYTLVQRVYYLVLVTEGYSVAEIEKKTGVSERSQWAIRKKAYDRGFRPEEDPRILELYIIDGV